MEGDLKRLSLLLHKVLKAPRIKSTENVLGLAEIVDELLSSYHDDFLCLSLSPVVKECLQLLIDTLQNTTSSAFRIPSNIILKVLELLTSLTVSGSCVHYMRMQCRNLPTILLQVARDTNIVQTLRMIGALTRDAPTGTFHVREVETVLKLCSSNVLSSTTDDTVLSLSLHIMGCLCSNNPPILSWVKTQPSYDGFLKRLASLLSNKSVGIIMTSLHLLALLALKEKLGEKIFSHDTNLHQTVQLIFSVLSTSHDSIALHNTVCVTRLLLLGNEHFPSALSGYSQLVVSLNKLIKRLTEVNADNCAKILEMLCVLSDLPEIGGQIAGLLFPPPGRSSRKPSRLIECVMAVVMETDHAYTCAIINGLNLCHTLLKTHMKVTQSSVMPIMRGVSCCLGNQQLTYSEGEECIDLSLRKKTAALALLHTIIDCHDNPSLLHDESITSSVVDIISGQFKHNMILNGMSDTADQWSSPGINVTVSSLHYLLTLHQCNEGNDKVIEEYLQDSRTILCIAHALKGGTLPAVQHSLHLLNYTLTAGVHNIYSFSEVLVNNSASIYCPSPSPSLSGATPTSERLSGEDRAMRDVTNVIKGEGVVNGAVEKLIEKFQSGLQLKDVRVSEIMSVYEHRLQVMASKEMHLQEFLDAKNVALSHADRLLNQYREKMRMSDGELEKTRYLMRDTELESERLHDKVIVHQRAQQEFEATVNQLKSDNNQLLLVAEQHKLLAKAHEEQSHSLHEYKQEVSKLQNVRTELERNIAELQSINHSLNQTIACKTSEVDDLTAKLKHYFSSWEESETNCRRLRDAVQERDSQISSLKNTRDDLENKVLDLSNALADCEDRNKNTLSQLEELKHEKQKAIHQLEVRIQTIQQERDALAKEVNLFSAVKDLISKGKA